MANLVPISNEGLFYINGLVVSNSTTNLNQVINVSEGRAALYSVVDPNVSFDTVVSNTISANSSLRGVGGLDQGTIAPNKVYAVYVVSSQANEEVPAVVLSLSLKSPQMPVGKRGFVYDLYRLVGYAVTNASSQFLLSYTFGMGGKRKFTYDTSIRVVNALQSITFVLIDCSSVVPAIDNTPMAVSLQTIPTVASSFMTVLPFGSPGAGQLYCRNPNTSGTLSNIAEFRMVTDVGIPKFSIKGNNATVLMYVDVLGFEYLV